PDTVIDFNKDLTVLVGQNGSGKSNIIDLIRFLADSMKLGLEGAITKRHGIKALRRWSSGHPLILKIRIEVKNHNIIGSYEFEITSHKKHEYIVKNEKANVIIGNEHHQYSVINQKWKDKPKGLNPSLSPLNLALPLISGDERFKPLHESLKNMAVYHIFPETLRTPQKYDPNKPMEEFGKNWVSILKDQNIASWKPELLNALGKLTGEIDDIDLQQVSGYLLARFRHGQIGTTNKSKWFEASQESDGTLRIAGIISALLQEPALSVIGIEEPELTIHPGAIPLIFDYINQAVLRSQVILTTHSPELLDCVKTEHVRVVEKKNYITTVSKMSDDQVEAVKNGLLTLGEIHRNQGLLSEQLSMSF
ncbi:MAG: ATP-binding protein, partial [Bacteroidota bacterium]